MSKTFKSVVRDDTEILIDRMGSGIFVTFSRGDKTYQATTIASADAPALALAILEAAGWPNEYLATTEILRRLRELDEHLKAVEAEAKDKAELEAEALDFCNAHREALDLGYIRDFREMVESGHDGPWLAVALKAREIGGRAEK